MAGPKIAWTPRGSGLSSRSLELPGGSRSLQLFRGGSVTDAAISVSRAGQSVSVVHDAWSEYRVVYRAISPWGDVDARDLFDRLGAWWEHAGAGGEWSFALDGDRTGSTTTDATVSQGDGDISVSDESGFHVDDWILIEDADDVTKFERKQIEAISSGQLDLHFPTLRSFASGSVVRDYDYFPKCVVASSARTPLMERAAGEGPFFDLDFEFRTVR